MVKRYGKLSDGAASETRVMGLRSEFLNDNRYDIILTSHPEFVGYEGVERTMRLLRNKGNN
jgi:hypothetical protein